ncbi:MRG/MORF4L-binding protein isoform X2 [Monodelphis domestica]|uniref:MRG/MORF4L-binding protein isoform X2 n=1 Tax=Monodelphis domestica TaxID=13616 RepID=UPI0024E1E3CE|nr:MRG/MORF4L-binding protein isoform X2 [Monodelphis domestica]
MSGLEELAPQYTGTDTGAGTSTGTTGPGGDGESGQEPSDSAISRGQGQEGAAPSAQARGRARRRAAARGRRGRARSAQQLRRSLSRDRTMGEAEVATGGSGGGSGPGSGAGGGGGGGPGSGPGPGGSGEKGPVESAPGPPEEVVVWSPEVEVCLFHAMLGHKPVGVNRHFHMICIRDKFSQNIGRQISSKVIWDHLSTMYDMQALHESEILPFPNSEKNFILPEEIIQEVKEGKVMIEDEVKEEIKEEMDSHTVFTSSGNLGKGAEKSSGKEKEKSSSDSGSKEGADKRKRNRVTEKVLNANSNPSSPSAAKRRRT